MLDYFIGKSYFGDDGSQNHNISTVFLSLLQHLLVVIEFQHGNVKGCHKKAINCPIH